MLNKTSRETGEFGAITTKNFGYSYNGYNQLIMAELDSPNSVIAKAENLDSVVSNLSPESSPLGVNEAISSFVGSNLFTYTYDETGLRTSKTVGDRTTNFIYENGNIVLESDAEGFTTAKNTFVGSVKH